MGKQIAIDMTEVLSQLDQSALTLAQQDEFKGWLQAHPSMQTTIQTALRRGFLVKAQSTTYRRQTEYWLRIEDSKAASEE